jgi:site-specific recombinase XerD
MSPLRQKMIELMTFRQLAPKTHQTYLSTVTKLSTYYHRLPEEISAEEVTNWLMKIAAERKWSASTVHQTMMALKFCYYQVLEKTDFFLDIPLPKKPQKIPVLLTQKEVYAILRSTRNLKHLTLLSLCYGCGLRASEAVALTQNDIDSERLLLRVEQGLPINQLQQFLGHSDIKITMKYLHWVPRAHVMACDLLAQFSPDAFILDTKLEVKDDCF